MSLDLGSLESGLPPDHDGAAGRLPFARRDGWVALALSLVLLGCFVAKSAQRHGAAVFGRRPGLVVQRVEPLRLPVDSAAWHDFVQLDGIGETLARRIVADREQNGPFGSVEGLLRVRGIGPKTLAKMRPYLNEPVDSVPVDVAAR